MSDQQEKKKFKDTKVGKFLSEKAPNVLLKVLDVADDYFPPAKILTSLLEGAGLKPEDVEEANKLIHEYRIEMEKQSILFEQTVTDRWKSDNESDNVWAKITRPITMLYLLLLMSVIAILDSIGGISFEVKPAYISLFETLLVTVVIAFFGSRGVEKVMKTMKK